LAEAGRGHAIAQTSVQILRKRNIGSLLNIPRDPRAAVGEPTSMLRWKIEIVQYVARRSGLHEDRLAVHLGQFYLF
jgi:hypothetical protein